MEYKSIYHSKVGYLTIKSDGDFLTGLDFGISDEDRKKLDEQAESGKRNNTCAEDKPEVIRQTEKWLDIYFSGGIPDFTPKMKATGTEFALEVWEILKTIPYGTTTSYKEIADRIAAQRGIARMSAQAVGGAVGRNPIAIIVPCHRVIGKNGNLTGFGGGIDVKKKLLSLEHIDFK